MTESAAVPFHVGFIMDGNGRWAQRRNLPRNAGHSAGARALEKILDCCLKHGIRVATFYAFSTENWKRPRSEVDALMSLLDSYIRDIKAKIKNGENETYRNISIRFIGDLSVFSEERRNNMRDVERLTDDRDPRLVINIAVNYGGRNEIVASVNRFISDNPGKEITEKDVSDGLYTSGYPDPDLIIRTAGEMRLSNFLIWQSAYSEYYSAPVFWPDFDEKEFLKAIDAFSKRTRKFGDLAK